MIYPALFPVIRNNESEEKVFNSLSHLKDKYDIFYARKFVALNNNERSESEIDFIICIPNRAMLCLEVKGGILRFDGTTTEWFQNSHILNPGPDSQASNATHSLINRYKDLSSSIPIGWALCFPDCEIPYGAALPPMLPHDKIIDQKSLIHLNKALNAAFEILLNQFPNKKGCKYWQYNSFKSDILRGIGFVQLLSTRVKQDEEKFIQLEEEQLKVFKHVIDNSKIIVYGPAGSGKTLIAKTLAQESASEGKRTFLTCFNKTLANKLAYETGIRDNPFITVSTFHSFGKRRINSEDPEWWEQSEKDSEGFWDIEVPAKLDTLNSWDSEYDYLIIDEGQDFKEFWFELLFRLVKKEGKIIIFLDKMQDIFNRNIVVPTESSFFKYTLNENCRNTKKIVQYLERVVDEVIPTKNTPLGDDVVLRNCKNGTEIQKQVMYDIQELVRDHRISSEQILIILNTEKDKSSIATLNKIGNLPLKSLDSKARFDRDTIYFTSINTFKGLELDIIFILDIHLIPLVDQKKRIYTEASRAKHKLYTYKVAAI